ncbi:MAG: DUF2332 domain-containing protein [Ilumatobacteraceae bacterium]
MTQDGADSTGAASLVRMFTEFAATTERRAPLYSALSTGVSQRPHLYALLLQAPPTQRLPVLLFAVVHRVLLDHPTEPLARWYPNLTIEASDPSDPMLMPEFEAFVVRHDRDIRGLLATRSTQTNEVGRCALLLPAFAQLADEVGPLAHIDVGASGGLNLQLDRFEYRYVSRDGTGLGTVGGPSAVVNTTEVSGPMPIPAVMPAVGTRYGIDLSPIDVTDTSEARWLEACVWPDQADRFHRLVAAIEIARQHPVELLEGDAVTSLAPTIDRVGPAEHPVITNSWVLNYLTPDARAAYLTELDRIGAARDLSWVYAESPALIPELPTPLDPSDPQLTVLTLVRWRNGARSVDHLATCHPHGFWITWH